MSQGDSIITHNLKMKKANAESQRMGKKEETSANAAT